MPGGIEGSVGFKSRFLPELRLQDRQNLFLVQRFLQTTNDSRGERLLLIFRGVGARDDGDGDIRGFRAV
jgi:hypothetical protein